MSEHLAHAEIIDDRVNPRPYVPAPLKDPEKARWKVMLPLRECARGACGKSYEVDGFGGYREVDQDGSPHFFCSPECANSWNKEQRPSDF